MICLIPIGKIDKKIMTYLKEELEEEFGEVIEIGQRFSEPDYAYNPLRGQYHVSTILRKIEKEKPNRCQKMLGIVNVDLYTKGLNFIFGQASLLTKVALISLVRLRQEYYSQVEDKNLFKERAKKEAIHELGHIYGLDHCQNLKCVMHFSNTLFDTDKKSSFFCSKCQASLGKRK